MSRPTFDRNYSFDVRDDAAIGLDSNALARNNPQAQYRPYTPQQPPQLPLSPPPGYSYEPPAPPAHRSPPSHSQNPFDDSYSSALRPGSDTTAGMDNLGASAAGGGIAGIAYGVAHTNERESGLQAARGLPQNDQGHREQSYDPVGSDTPYIPEHPPRPRGLEAANSSASTIPLTAAAAAGAGWAPRSSPSHGQDVPLGDYPSAGGYEHARSNAYYADSPYKRYSSPWDPRVDTNAFDPNDIEDDGDDDLAQHGRGNKRRSFIGLGRQPSSRVPAAGAAAGGAAAGGALGKLGGVIGSRDSSGNYGPVGAGEGAGGSGAEKSQWLAKEAAARKRKKLFFVILGVIIVIAIIVGATVGGILASRKQGQSSSTSGSETAAQDDANGDLDANSDEIKKLLNNKDLHRVFPGIDYTPYNGQYPDCLSNPPSQNNVTRDMAVLSQLTKTIRLYGTDCNQTDMVLHSIKQLGLNDVKIWPAVWLDNNATTNARGMKAITEILGRVGADPFAGVIVGNEVLYRKDMTAAQLSNAVGQVKSNLTKLGLDLPVAVADLGDNWKADLVEDVDVIMSNIHPFFAGVTADEAAGWTWDFWQQHDVVLTAGNATKKNIISEVGWPSDGGNDCGASTCTSKTQGSVAGIDEMNKFMDSFICQSLKNGTDFFW